MSIKKLCIMIYSLFLISLPLFSQNHEEHNHNKSQTQETINTNTTKEDKTKPTKSTSAKEPESVVEPISPSPEPAKTGQATIAEKENSAQEKENTSHYSHSHQGVLNIPAGLMLPQVHKSKDWMVDYLYMQMDMKSLYNGSNVEDPNKYLFGIEYNPSINASSLGQTGSTHNHGTTTTTTQTNPDPLPSFYTSSLNLQPYRYMSMPVSMKMEMTMISLMKNINDKTSIMFMLPYLNNSMEMVSGNLEKSFMRTQGVGDIGITLAHKLIEKENHTINLQFGVTLPTGSIDEKNLMPLMGKIKSPYNMQLGTGTYNTIPGISYIFTMGKFTLGGFGQVTLRNGKNDNGYRFGNRYEFSAWTSYSVLNWLAPTLRITSTKWDNISGADSSLDPTMDPQNDPNRQGGRRIDVLVGLNFYFPSFSEKMKAGLEFGKPAYQHLNGPQLGTNSLLNFRFQASF